MSVRQAPNAQRLIEQGIALRRQGKLAEAARAYEQAIETAPALAEAHYNLGIVRRDQGRIRDAAQCWRRAVELKPNFIPAYNNLGGALLRLGDVQGALAQHRRMLELDPNSVAGHINLGNALRQSGDPMAAIASYEKAITLRPSTASAFANLGLALRDLRRFAEAEAAYRRAIALQADYPIAHKDLGILLLMLGRFEEGWREYAWRWKTQWHVPRTYDRPWWRGEDIAGRTVLLHMDQGHGDTIHFLRYVPMVAARGARVILEVQKPLKRLCSSLKGVDTVVAAGELPPPFDLFCPLLDLPRIFDTRIETIPAEVPYLSADPAAADAWQREFAGRPGLKVGLVWAGNPAFSDDFRRSPGAGPLASVLAVERVSFYGLQVGPAAEAIKQIPGGEKVELLGRRFADFADTAACIAALDLVIASCTSVPHLAGALNKPVWIALGFTADWRWMLERADSPWYPSARLFRQSAEGDWGGVYGRVAAALREMAAG